MRKRYLFIISLLFSSSGFCQNWCPPGASWIFRVHSIFLQADALVEYNYTKDTVVGGKLCKQIKATFAGKFPGLSFNLTHTVIPNFKTYHTFEEARVLYIYNRFDGFDTVINYAASPGDKWLAPRKYQCANRACYTVKDTATIIVNGFSLRTMTVTTDDNFPGYPTEFLTMERFYPIQRTTEMELFPFSCKNYFSDFPDVSFNCYRDDSAGSYNPESKSCIWGVGLSENDYTSSPVLYPNPFQDFLVFEGLFAAIVRILDVNGKIIFEERTDNSGRLRINTSSFSRSFYLVNIVQKDGSTRAFKAIKN